MAADLYVKTKLFSSSIVGKRLARDNSFRFKPKTIVAQMLNDKFESRNLLLHHHAASACNSPQLDLHSKKTMKLSVQEPWTNDYKMATSAQLLQTCSTAISSKLTNEDTNFPHG